VNGTRGYHTTRRRYVSPVTLQEWQQTLERVSDALARVRGALAVGGVLADADQSTRAEFEGILANLERAYHDLQACELW
jgi:hypothetical protein